ncbi:PQQ-dependent sugar dehydrogenase [Pseudorhodoferax sp.]|uniref:PQQ-dependent sugar dehydrogenase n=1 Tax=Pseudorhodoferax sp. TaxID=1993553 RepID=UPI002DD6984E|nr:PQQ-dependent sugar dehydrogenase [Pseudorhodoferax sp.]
MTCAFVRLCTAAALAAIALGLPCRAAAAPQPPPEPRSAVVLYEQFCAGCHGDRMEGGKARGFVSRGDAVPPGAEALARAIRQGDDKAGMPAFGAVLRDAEVHALVALIRDVAGRAQSPRAERAREIPTAVQHSAEHRYRIETLARGLDVPWSIAFLPDGRLLFTERSGDLFVMRARRGRWGAPRRIAGVPPVWVEHEAGLMSVLPHPDFAHNRWLYLSLSDRPRPRGDTHPGTNLKIIRARLQGHRLVDHQTVYAAPAHTYSDKGINFGGRLLFDGPHLFFSFGERGETGQAQRLDLPNGKLHRVFDDGRIPPGNPFAGRAGAVGSIWTFGHRNPQGLARNPADGRLWASEHGPRGGDELNHIRRGRNYGWPLATHGMNYDGTPVSAHTRWPGTEAPVLHWTPSIAVSALHFYGGDAFPGWKQQLFIGSLGEQELIRAVVDGRRIVHQEVLLKDMGRVRDIATGPDGLLYLALEMPHEPSVIVRLVPAESPGNDGRADAPW